MLFIMAEKKKRKMNPNSLKNLEKGRKFSKRSEDEARKEGHKGGVNSGIARDLKKRTLALIEDYVQRKDTREAYVEKMKAMGWNENEVTHINEIINGAILKAKSGDVQAIKYVLGDMLHIVENETNLNMKVNGKMSFRDFFNLEDGYEP